MNQAFEVITDDIAHHLNSGFPLEAYMPARAFSALVEAGVDPWSLELSPAEIIRAILVKRCLEALAA